MEHQPLQGGGRQSLYLLVHLRTEFLQEIIGERGNVLPSFPQGGQLDGYDVDPIEQVFTEQFLFYQLRKIFISSHDYPNIH